MCESGDKDLVDLLRFAAFKLRANDNIGTAFISFDIYLREFVQTSFNNSKLDKKRQQGLVFSTRALKMISITDDDNGASPSSSWVVTR